jgi:glycosyltransferase involved in cell wall biosynthesis
MKILFVCGIYPPDAGGPALYARRMAREMVRMGHEVRVITLSDEGGVEDDGGVRVTRLPRPGVRVHARSLRTWREVVRQAPWADLVYDNGCPWDTGFPVLWGRPLFRRPIVVKITGDIPWEFLRIRRLIDHSLDEFQTHKYPPLFNLLRWTQHYVVRHVNRVITPSQYLKKLAVGWGAPDNKVQVILNALDAPDIPADAADMNLRVPQDTFKLITVARLVPHKGVDRIINVVADLPGTSLIVVGDGQELDNLKQQARAMGVADRVAFTGRQPHADVMRLLSRCDLFVLNTEYEGLPHSILEAFAAGLPVVTTDICGNPEVVQHGHNGFLVPVRDDAALRDRVRDIMNDASLRDTFVQRSREKLKDFSWQRLYNSTMALFEDVIRSAGGRP